MKRLVLPLLLASLCAPLSAFAHAHLKQSDPANGSTLTVAPDHFTLTFSESAHLTALSIQKEGDPTPQKIPNLPQDASDHFSLPAPKLSPGVYTLRFRNVAADDNHVMAGAIRFTVAPAAKPPA